LALEGYTEQEISSAIEHCKISYAWPPTIAEFIEEIKPDYIQLGLPLPRQAYLEAAQGASQPSSYRWSHPIIYFTGADTDWYRLRNDAEAATYSDFCTYYKQYARMLARGDIDFQHLYQRALPDLKKSTKIVQQTMQQSEQQLQTYITQHAIEPGLEGMRKLRDSIED